MTGCTAPPALDSATNAELSERDVAVASRMVLARKRGKHVRQRVFRLLRKVHASWASVAVMEAAPNPYFPNVVRMPRTPPPHDGVRTQPIQRELWIEVLRKLLEENPGKFERLYLAPHRALAAGR